MKDIMWREGQLGDEDDIGRLELLQRSAGVLSTLMRVDLDEAKRAILSHLRDNGITSVKTIREEWPKRPDDLYTDKAYRRQILELEECGDLVVLDDDMETVLPPNTRQNRPTGRVLPPRLFIRLAE